MKNTTTTSIPSTLAGRLGWASLASAAFVLLLAVVALTAVEYFHLRRAMMEDSSVEATILAHNLSSAVLFDDQAAAIETLQTMSASSIVNRVVVQLPDGRSFAAVPGAAAVHAAHTRPGHSFADGEFSITAPIDHAGATIGYVTLQKSLSRLHQQFLAYLLSAIGVAGGALLLMWILVGRAKRMVADAEKQLYDMAHIDTVTEVWNRNAFNAFLGTSMHKADAGGDSVAVLLLDLDNFKMVNDIFGHHGGDDLLRKVAGRLATALTPHDILCRLGGDEFAAILTGRADVAALRDTALAVSRLFAEPFVIEGQEMHITCSVGISLYPNDAADMPELVRHADIAMYRAKTEGKNTYQLFAPEMNDRIKKRALLEAGLRRALEKNELSLHFQPLYDLQSQRLVGAEALLRWNSQELGNVSPMEFIPIAEECGLIIPIGDWVLRTVCEKIAEWQQRGLQPPRVSINLSVSQLRSPGVARHILDIIAACAVDPRMLELELTESVLMEHVDQYIDGFALLQLNGITLSIDDFGTGYSSMAYLKRLPLDKIKIDRAFVNDLPHAQNDRQIVAAIVAMAHNLGLTVTAEGVERQEQSDFLREIGCDTVQGYYFSRPLPVESFETLLSKSGSAPAERSIAIDVLARIPRSAF